MMIRAMAKASAPVRKRLADDHLFLECLLLKTAGMGRVISLLVTVEQMDKENNGEHEHSESVGQNSESGQATTSGETESGRPEQATAKPKGYLSSLPFAVNEDTGAMQHLVFDRIIEALDIILLVGAENPKPFHRYLKGKPMKGALEYVITLMVPLKAACDGGAISLLQFVEVLLQCQWINHMFFNWYPFPFEGLLKLLEIHYGVLNAVFGGFGAAPETCDHCQAVGSKLQRCGHCKVARYCSRDYQRNAWSSGHREACTLAVVVDKEPEVDEAQVEKIEAAEAAIGEMIINVMEASKVQMEEKLAEPQENQTETAEALDAGKDLEKEPESAEGQLPRLRDSVAVSETRLAGKRIEGSRDGEIEVGGGAEF